MKHLGLKGLVSILVVSGILGGCEIITEEPSGIQLRPASHVVINEVFALPASHQAPYSWIELLNPTPDTVDIGRWSLSFTTYKLQNVGTVILDSLFQFRFFLSFETLPPEFGAFDIPFAQRIEFSNSGIAIQDTFKLRPQGLYTIVSSEARLRDHTEWGPGPTNSRFSMQAFTRIDSFSIDTTHRGNDSIIAVFYQTDFTFQFQPSDQLVLRNAAGQVVDVVRYGNYAYPGPGADPYPNNHSLGIIPQYESLARYAGGYSTDNTAFDFFVTDVAVRPIPHWYSQKYKQ